MSNFDHASVFPLEVRHAEIECLGCHTPQGFTATQAACVSCHEEPEIHAGSFGLKCEMCHNAQAWQPALLRIHDFPLDHGDQGESACAVCHSGAYTEYTCYHCHEHEETELKSGHLQEGVAVEKFPDCVACHLDGHIQGDE